MYSFEVKSAFDLFKKLEFEYIGFLNNKCSSFHAINFALTAWHIIDWLHEEEIKYKSTSVSFNKFRDEIVEKCGSLKIMRDIANGSKHAVISRYTPEVKSSELKLGLFESGLFEEGLFEGDELIIEIENDQKIIFESIASEIIKFWTNFFKFNR
jgi:hypothetical protein